MNQALEPDRAAARRPTSLEDGLPSADAPSFLPLVERAFPLYEAAGYACVHLAGQDMSADALRLLYSVREPAYRAHLKGDHTSVSFDPRDRSYAHVLIVSKLDGRILAGMRLMPSSREGGRPVPTDSYLEYSFPGFYRWFSAKAPFLELSRLFFAVEADAKGALFIALYRGIRMFAESISCHTLAGLTSYNHFAHEPLSTAYFLTCLTNDAFFDKMDTPAPRHPLDIDLTLNPELKQKAMRETRLAGVERSIQELGEATFQVFPITRIYLTFLRAKIIGFSVGKSYNGLTELLMYSDLNTHSGRYCRAP